MLKLFEDYLKELSYKLHGCNSLQDGASIKTAIQQKYFEKLFDLCVNNHQKIYILFGKEIDEDKPLQPLFASFEEQILEKFKLDYLDRYDSFYIESCSLV